MHPALAATFAAFLLAACTQTGGPSAPPPTPPQPGSLAAAGVTSPDFRLPEGAGCTGQISRFRAIMRNDLETGHTTQNVFNAVGAELDAASRVCADGRDGEATRMVRATRAKFGYPV